jgi:hypothetical protein
MELATTSFVEFVAASNAVLIFVLNIVLKPYSGKDRKKLDFVKIYKFFSVLFYLADKKWEYFPILKITNLND